MRKVRQNRLGNVVWVGEAFHHVLNNRFQIVEVLQAIEERRFNVFAIFTMVEDMAGIGEAAPQSSQRIIIGCVVFGDDQVFFQVPAGLCREARRLHREPSHRRRLLLHCPVAWLCFEL